MFSPCICLQRIIRMKDFLFSFSYCFCFSFVISSGSSSSPGLKSSRYSSTELYLQSRNTS